MLRFCYWEPLVKLLMAVIQPTKLETVRRALEKIGVESITVCDARGYARQRGQSPTYRGHQYKANLLRKVAIEILAHQDRVEQIYDVLLGAARTGPDGAIGDGKVFTLPAIDAIRLSDGVRGEEAVG